MSIAKYNGCFSIIFYLRNVSLLTIPIPIVDLTASLKHNSDAFSKCFTEVGRKYFSIRYHFQISSLILSKFKRKINFYFLSNHQKTVGYLAMSVRGSRGSLNV